MSEPENNKQKSKEICFVCEGMAIHNAIEAISMALIATIMGALEENENRIAVTQIVADDIVRRTKRLIEKEQSSEKETKKEE